ncbi:MAG: hypothetical protein DWQ07_16195 [Chloroflexi bacterium]|nr:MAG: hypothetical protein DWQ07_16195 [Chloroflexota bacterium]MBL1195293.1 hypothetical protein [Chloroflexota bacterium]
MLDRTYARDNFRLWYKGKTLFGDVYKWFEDDWIDEGYAFKIRRYRFPVHLFPSVELSGVIIPTEGGSVIKAKISYAPFLSYGLFFVFAIILFASSSQYYGDLQQIGIFLSIFLLTLISFLVSITRSILDLGFLRNIIPERFLDQ